MRKNFLRAFIALKAEWTGHKYMIPHCDWIVAKVDLSPFMILLSERLNRQQSTSSLVFNCFLNSRLVTREVNFSEVTEEVIYCDAKNLVCFLHRFLETVSLFKFLGNCLVAFAIR